MNTTGTTTEELNRTGVSRRRLFGLLLSALMVVQVISSSPALAKDGDGGGGGNSGSGSSNSGSGSSNSGSGGGDGDGGDDDHGGDDDGDNDRRNRDDVRDYVRKGKLKSLAQILARVRKSHPGDVVSVKLDRVSGDYVYRIRLIDTGGVLVRLTVDAASSAILSAR